MQRLRWLSAVLAVMFLAAPALSWAQDEFEDFGELDMNDLLNMQVVSSTKVAQSIMDSPNAIWVITAEDIKRSGYRTIPEALKLAPGIYVAQMGENSWSVSMEGFAHGQYVNNILVMVDGVSMYSVVDGGVEWEDLPVSIDEVERIEVVRGPGGVLYGANAVNGVINIITYGASKSSPDYVTARGGTQGVQSASAAKTFVTDDGKAATRVTMNYGRDDGVGIHNGANDFGSQESHQASVETDVRLTDSTNLLLEANYKQAALNYDLLISQEDAARQEEQTVFRTRIDQEVAGGSWYLQGFSRHFIRQGMVAGQWIPYSDRVIQDLEFQQMIPFAAAGPHKFIYGGGYRWITLSTGSAPSLQDAEEHFTIGNAYLHDEWSFTDQLKLNAGVKYEDVSLTDPTWQWRAALIYQPRKNHSFRVGASNAYRSPHIAELYYSETIAPLGAYSPPPPGWTLPWALATVRGAQELDPEQVQSYEFGYRGVYDNRIVLDVTYAYRQYDDLIALIKENPGIFVPGFGTTENAGQIYSWDNQGSAHSNSIEVGVDARLSDQWRVLANYSYLDLQTNEKSVENRDTNIPRNMGRIQLGYTSPTGLMVDASGAYTDQVKVVFINDPDIVHEIDDYWRLDLRVAQRFTSEYGDVTVGVVGTNLGQEWHEEYANFAHEQDPTSIRRGYYGFIEISE